MLSDFEYVQTSLELNLFFMRIMKEHSFFLESAFPQKNFNLIQQADNFKNQFACLLTEAVRISDGTVSPEFLKSGEVVTNLTLEAERLTEFYTGQQLFTDITRMELSMGGGGDPPLATLVDMVNRLNEQAIDSVQGLINFKTNLLNVNGS